MSNFIRGETDKNLNDSSDKYWGFRDDTVTFAKEMVGGVR